jgi:DNA-binding IclR family transcriptional regulator
MLHIILLRRGMIQVLERAFRILEWLARADAPPRRLSEIAAYVGMSPAACSHVLRTMVRYGYVVQVAPRGGYRLGPMAAMLGRHHHPHDALIAVGQPLVERVADETGETTLLACLHGSRRLILCHAEGKQTIRVSSDAIVLEDIYGTATGRVLLAYLDEGELTSVLSASPPAGIVWDTAASMEELTAALVSTREAGFAVNPDHEDMAQVAFPVRLGGSVVASIGCFAPVYRFDEEHRSEMISALRAAAADLSGALCGVRQQEVRQ